LERYRLESLTHLGFDWQFTFDNDARLVVACLWRLLEDGRIRVTSSDQGQKYGLPAPIEAAREVNTLIAGAQVESIVLRPYTLDLMLKFSATHTLQIIPNSSGYEAWQLYHKTAQFIAVGGGELTIFGHVT
jgi:hypothetical protein